MDIKCEQTALSLAVRFGATSPCVKSKRGVVLFCRTNGLLGMGYNHPPEGFRCDGSEECLAACARICAHAETDALADFNKKLTAGFSLQGNYYPEMLHVKVIGNEAVASGEPSCWQCSRHVINFGIKAFWLLHEGGLRCYSSQEFHEKTLQTCKLPVIR